MLFHGHPPKFTKSPFLPMTQSGRSRRPLPSEQVLREVRFRDHFEGNKGAEEKLTVCKRVRVEVLELPPFSKPK